jgi:hypothetical protein
MIRYGAAKRLSDNRKDRLGAPADQQWARSVWMPRTIGAGWKYWALVQPEELSQQAVMKSVTSFLYISGLILQVFNEIEPANAWLDLQ